LNKTVINIYDLTWIISLKLLICQYINLLIGDINFNLIIIRLRKNASLSGGKRTTKSSKGDKWWNI